MNRAPVVSTAILALVLCHGIAQAQERDEAAGRSTEVFELRARPQLTTGFLRPGIRPRGTVYQLPANVPALQEGSTFELGRFVLQPAASVRTSYDDNIDADAEDERDDVIVSGDAGLRLQSRFRRHALGAEIAAGYDRFLQNEDESSGRVRLGGDGRVDFTRSTRAIGRISYLRDEEDRESTEFDRPEGGDGKFHQFDGRLGFAQDLRVTRFTLDGGVGRIDFDSDEDSDRDRFIYSGSASAERDITSRLILGLTPEWQRTDYDRTDRDSGLDRDETRARLLALASYQANAKLRTEATLGYSIRLRDDADEDDEQGVVVGAGLDYVRDERLSARLALVYDGADASDFDDVDALPITVNAGVRYIAGKNTEVTADLARGITESDVGQSSRKIATSARGGVTYLLSRETSLSGAAGVSREEFDEANRTDDIVFGELVWSWAFHPRAQLDLSYRYSQRFSDIDSEEFTRNIVSLGLATRF